MTEWPKIGTRVRRDDTGQRGRYTGNGGRVGDIPIAMRSTAAARGLREPARAELDEDARG